ncbi:hypothetical protein ACWF82_32315 [Nocardia sp. NPDC055053]
MTTFQAQIHSAGRPHAGHRPGNAGQCIRTMAAQYCFKIKEFGERCTFQIDRIEFPGSRDGPPSTIVHTVHTVEHPTLSQATYLHCQPSAHRKARHIQFFRELRPNTWPTAPSVGRQYRQAIELDASAIRDNHAQISANHHDNFDRM